MYCAWCVFFGVYDCCVVLVVVCMKSRCRLVLLVYAVGWRNWHDCGFLGDVWISYIG